MTSRSRRMLDADKLVARARAIVEYYRPRLWWIENPWYGDLRWRAVVQGLSHVDIDYCKFTTWGYNKPTRFWVPRWLAEERDHVVCRKDCANMLTAEDGQRRHRVQLGGMPREGVKRESSRDQQYRIPDEVVGYLTGVQDLSFIHLPLIIHSS